MDTTTGKPPPTRGYFTDLCRRAFVPQRHWHNRDSAGAQRQVGECLALLRAGCDFRILTVGLCASNQRTWWIEILFKGFDWFEVGDMSDVTFYLPTEERLAESNGKDWY